ncbi:MAG: helix-turn-helix transcriptional regulator [Clostridium sp.]|nr:helix-turn-helix transcriptional regulator [Clostridium sp.]
MNKLYKEIGQRIAALRQENQITQAQLAEKLDISIKHCSEVERGLAGLSLEKLIALCPILSTDLDYLLRGIEKRAPSESNVPNYILNLFNSNDAKQKKLLQEYLILFKQIYDHD